MGIKNLPLNKLYDKAKKCKQEKAYIGYVCFFILFCLAWLLMALALLAAIITLIFDIYIEFFPNKIEIPKEIVELQKEYEQTKETYKTNPKALEVKIDSIWEKAISIPATDKKGNRGIIEVYTLTGGYYWGKGKNEIFDVLESNHDINLDQKFIAYLKTEYFKKGFAKHNEIICVGNSSFEEDGNKSNEECRSYKRALQLRRLLEESSTFSNIQILPIGISDSTGLPSDLQRSVIIIGVKKIDSLINMKDALYDHLLHDTNTPFRFWDYSLCKSYEDFYNSTYKPCSGSEEFMKNE